MRILCQHGYYKLYPATKADLVDFIAYLGGDTEFAPVDDYYTFDALKLAPDYSVLTKSYLGIPATITFEGKPWEIFRENRFVFNLALNAVVPIASIAGQASLSLSGGYYVHQGPFLQAGAVDASGRQIVDWDGNFSMTDLLLYIRTVGV